MTFSPVCSALSVMFIPWNPEFLGQLVREVCTEVGAHHGGSAVAGPCRTRSWYAASLQRETGENAQGAPPAAPAREPATPAAPAGPPAADTVRKYRR